MRVGAFLFMKLPFDGGNKQMKCPNCGTELDVDDVYDTDQSGMYVIEKVSGGCSTCGKEYTWRRQYEMIFRDECDCNEC